MKVGDEVYVKVYESDYKTIAYEGSAIIMSIYEDGFQYRVDSTSYSIFPSMGDIIRPITKLDKALA